MGQIEDKLKTLNLSLIRRSKLPATHCQCKRHGNLLYIGGVSESGEADYETGKKLGKKFVAVMVAASDGMDDIEAVLNLTVAVRGSTPATASDSAADGVSDAIVDFFGARGCHTRTVIGVNALENQASILCGGVILLRSDRNV